MALISSEELSKQLQITTKKLDSLNVTGSAIDLSEAQRELTTVRIGKLTDQFPDLQSQISGGIPDDLAAKLTDQLPGGLEDVESLFAGATPALHELGKLQTLQDFGPAIGGIQPLVKSSEDLIDDVADDLPELLKETKPVLAKIDQSMASEIESIKTAIPSADLANMEKLFTLPSTEGGVATADMFEKVTPPLETAAAVTKEVFTDGSVEAISEELKELTNLDTTQLSSTLEKFAGGNLTKDLSSLLDKSSSGDLVNLLKASTDKLDTVLNGTIDNLVAGGTLKGLVEKITNNVGSVILDLNLQSDQFDEFKVKNLILSADIDAAKDLLAAAVALPTVFSNLIGQSGSFKSREKAVAGIKKAEAVAVTPEDKAAILDVKAKFDAIDNKINKDLSGIAGSVTTSTDTTPPNNNPVSDAAVPKKAEILTSKQELIKYFQAANREISSIRIYAISDGKNPAYAPNKNGADAVAAGNQFYIDHKDRFPKIGPEGPGHFFVRTDGTIETMRDINEPSITDFAGNEYLLDICLNRYQDYETANQKQVESVMMKIVDAFITTFPMAQIYTGSVFSEGEPRFTPYFTLNISAYYPRRAIIYDPYGPDQKYLSKDELLALGKEEAEAAAQEIKDIQ